MKIKRRNWTNETTCSVIRHRNGSLPAPLELAADRDASGLFCAQVAPGGSVRSRSMQFGEYRVFQNATERRIVNSQSLPILDVSEVLELIHKYRPAAG